MSKNEYQNMEDDPTDKRRPFPEDRNDPFLAMASNAHFRIFYKDIIYSFNKEELDEIYDIHVVTTEIYPE